MSNITITIEGLDALAESINNMAKAFSGNAASAPKPKDEEKLKPKAEKKAKPDPKPEPEPEVEEEPVKEAATDLDYKADVLPHFTKLVKGGHTAEAKELLAKYGAKKGGDVSAEDLPAFLKDVKKTLTALSD